ncbi:class I adenylate-forming enzyme family protein [Halobacterium rubrum]|uniref:hypothetical protein n=1 Tax=Halobacterium TaxID=2239 RepID=UPI001F31F1C0|nr:MULTISPECIES: hypothetical protein [Halobacterium]MDH5021462.1 hypothetical protein [Halobacterium rubrum]
METVADVVAALDDPERRAVRHKRPVDARTTRDRVYKAGNALRHRGVRLDAGVAILDAPTPQALQTFLGASLLGATVEFGPDPVVDARVLAGPTAELGGYDLPAGSQRVAWGDPPADPSWMYFERDVWSENPAFPEPEIDADTALLRADGATHGEVVAAAERVADEHYGENDEVAVRAPLADPGTVVAGVVAPLIAGATIVLPPAGGEGTVAVAAREASDDAPESRVVSPADATPT